MRFGLFVALVLAPPPPAVSAPILTVQRGECPAPTFDKKKGDRGDRAIIADDGDALVLQCGDGSIRAWRANNPKLRNLGELTLFEAAQQEDIVPRGLPCPWPEIIRDQTTGSPDCEVVDHSDDQSTYILRNTVVLWSFVVRTGSTIRELSIWQRPGVLFPRRGTPSNAIVINGEPRPERLERLGLQNGTSTTLASLPTRNLIFEDGEGDANEIIYSTAYNLLIVSYSGAFRVAEDMTYIRAFTPDGKEKWRLRGSLPARDAHLIVGDDAQIRVVMNGRYGVLAKTSSRYASEVIELSSGRKVGSLAGWPLATSARAGRVLLKMESGALILVDCCRR